MNNIFYHSNIDSSVYHEFNIWDHSSIVDKLYLERALCIEEEMTCSAQAVELLSPHIVSGDTVVDVGCGTGYLFHSFRRRNVPVQYYGFDSSSRFIEVGLRVLSEFGLNSDRLFVSRIDDFFGNFDHVVCLNVLTNIDNFHRPLERLLLSCSKSLVLRESISTNPSYSYVVDNYLDSEKPLRVHVNTYSLSEVIGFIEQYGFSVSVHQDVRTRGQPEMVIDHPHHWLFLVASRI